MRFASPEHFILLGLLLFRAFFYMWLIRRKKKILARFGDIWLLLKNSPYISFARQGGKAAILLTGMLFLILTLSQLQCGTHMELMKREGIDLLIAIDVSNSMLAEDMKPNRIGKARQEVRGILDRLKGDRIGLLAFAGEAFVQCPLTLDYSAAELFLDVIDVGLIPQQGTAIGSAIRKATEAFERHERKHKVMILLTDGEDHNTDPIQAAEEARKEGVKIYTIGIGSPMGEPIPLTDRQGNRVGYKKDRDGEMIVTKLDDVTLQKVALTTGGKYYHATPGEMELDKVYDEIARMEKKELEGKLLMQYEDRFQYPLILAVLFIIGEFFISEKRRARSVKR
ncbi:MAG: VWA domain-containing protein [Candidatus Zixiibacteriota bacterium]|nr:MAG: VWA domain-containing protein [candidate division Zixibacteria bacterium]